jgi:hypothetical protein
LKAHEEGNEPYRSIMTMPLHGRVRGASIELDAPVPQLEGLRVLVLVEPEIEEGALSTAAQRVAWEDWVRQGHDGPIEDDGDPEFP